MEKNPISFLQEYMAKNHIIPSYTVIEGTPQNGFRIRLQCDQKSVVGEGINKKLAKTNAAIAMIQLLGIKYSKYRSVIENELITSNLSYISRLQEMAQKNGTNLPIYIDKATKGPPHMLTFTTICKYEGVEEEASASTKRDSKTLAAKKVFNRIYLSDITDCSDEVCQYPEKPDINSTSTIDVKTIEKKRVTMSVNYINKLQEIAQKNKSVLPVYTDKPSRGSLNSPVFTTVCKYGDIEEEASAATKKESKLLAARKVLECVSPTDYFVCDVTVRNTPIECKSYLESFHEGIKELNISEENQNVMTQSAEKALRQFQFLPRSQTNVIKQVNHRDHDSCNVIHTFLKDSFSDTKRELVMDKLQDLIRASKTYENSNDSSKPMALLQQILQELNVKVKEVNHKVFSGNFIYGLQLDTDPVISEIGYGDSKSSAVIQSVMQMAITVCILIA